MLFFNEAIFILYFVMFVLFQQIQKLLCKYVIKDI